MSAPDKVVLVTRKNPLGELIERFNTRRRSLLTHAGSTSGLRARGRHLPGARSMRSTGARAGPQAPGARIARWCRRTCSRPSDVVVALESGRAGGEHGEVHRRSGRCSASTRSRAIDGVLLTVHPVTVAPALRAVMGTVQGPAGHARPGSPVGRQTLLASTNSSSAAEPHLGQISARQRRVGSRRQSSSGVIVSTGAAAPGGSRRSSPWPRRCRAHRRDSGSPIRLTWEDAQLVWVVREPYVSKHSSARQTAGCSRLERR